MYIELHCVESNHRDDTWRINLDRGDAMVLGPDGRELIRLTPSQAASVFRMPSLANGNRFGLRQGKRIVEFTVSKEAAEQLRVFVAATPEYQHVEVNTQVRARAVKDVLIGLVAITAGVGVTIAGYMAASGGANGGKFSIFWGAPVVGVFWLLRGIGGFCRPADANMTRM